MKKILFILTLLLVVSNRGYAKGFPVAVASESPANIYSADDKEEKKTKVDSIEVRGKLIDSFTYECVDSVRMAIYSLPDTVLVDTLWNCREVKMNFGGWDWTMDGFFTKVPVHGKYLIRTEKRGYKPLDYAFEIPNRRYNRKVREWDLDEVKIHKANSYGMDRDLDEVTVTATKVKMVMAGDTVVYNADAFQLSEGSMLDELVRQLPGVEIRKGGDIYINGEKVQELLVNGNDFFNGDAKQALENLPAYVVQNIKAYQRESKHAYLDKHHEAQKKKDPWVLDVRLKREYAQGWLGNVEAGGGWDKRWMGRVFGIRYTDHSRITLFVNANNMNNMARPGSETSWGDYSSPTSEIKTVTGGLDFHVDDKVTKTEFNTSLNASRSTTDSQHEQSSQTFLQGGDVWSRSRNVSHNQSGSISWNGAVEFHKKELFSHISANLNYGTGKGHGSNRTATFSADPLDAHRGASLDSVFSPRPKVLKQQYAPLYSQRLMDFLTNRSEDLTQSDNHNFSPSLNAVLYTVAPWNGEEISLNFSENYSYAQHHDYSHYDLRQGETQDFRNRYTESPNKSHNFNLSFDHSLFSYKDIIGLGINYGYSNSYSNSHRDLYRLDSYTDTPWAQAEEGYPLGMLPSTRDSLNLAIDRENSYFSETHNQRHDTRLNLSGGGEWGYYYIGAGLNHHNDRSEDTRGQDAEGNPKYQDLHRKYSLWSVHANTQVRNVSLGFNFNQSAPGMTQMLDIRDDSNPLYISLGNPHLRNTYNLRYNLNYHHNSQKHQSSWYAGLNFGQGSGIGSATIYNRETGVYTTQPRNISGNWNAGANGGVNLPLDKQKRLTLNTFMGGSYNRSVDFSSDNPAQDFDHIPLSRVHNYGLNSSLSLEYRYMTYSVSANAEADYSHATSDRPGFMTINTVDFSYGVSSRLGFKHGYSLDMDLTMHSRRGYDDKTMNNDNLIFNLALSKGFFKNRCLVLKVTGHDILQQLDNVYRSINAQGRTETWYNTQPSYVIATASYRLDMKPKKRKE